ncbi:MULTISPECIES: hypothetical protein [Amycolatopsis]|uniref:Uncharacterized protein n=1 Tax=Amycolatopsis bullii TaxID=941987 RepID=A0ABQ3K7R7_9PSEU|nr:hypothetical protein [Amycolatopsis bullii]GHG03639.1 hypothetical protein GCM10017567_19310 [Amycolatopsis bullii]
MTLSDTSTWLPLDDLDHHAVLFELDATGERPAHFTFGAGFDPAES